MSFLHLHYPDVKDSIYNHARWEAVQKELVRENMFEDFVEAAGVSTAALVNWQGSGLFEQKCHLNKFNLKE